jgi:hypothetical protein
MKACKNNMYCCNANSNNDCCKDASALFSVNGTSPAASAASIFLASVAATASASISATSSPDNGGHNYRRTLTVGAIAGIAGGVIGLAVAGIILFCWIRKKRRDQQQQPPPDPQQFNNLPSPLQPPAEPKIHYQDPQQAIHYHNHPPMQQVYSPPPAYQSPISPLSPYPPTFSPIPGNHTPGNPNNMGGGVNGYYAQPHGNAVESDSRPVQRPVYEMSA